MSDNTHMGKRKSPFVPVTVRCIPELNYLVCVDGVPDDATTPYRGPDGLRSALIDASAIKAGEPDRVVTLQIIHSD